MGLSGLDLGDLHVGETLKRLWGVLQGFGSDRRFGIQTQPELTKTALTVCLGMLSLCRLEINTVRVLCWDNVDFWAFLSVHFDGFWFDLGVILGVLPWPQVPYERLTLLSEGCSPVQFEVELWWL